MSHTKSDVPRSTVTTVTEAVHKVVKIITYQDDKVWVASKQLAKLSGNKNDWTVVITYYNLSKGKRVKMFLLDKEGNYFRVIANTDEDNTVLLRDGKVKLIPHSEAKSYRKFFEMSEVDTPLVKLPLAESIKGDNYIYYNE